MREDYDKLDLTKIKLQYDRFKKLLPEFLDSNGIEKDIVLLEFAGAIGSGKSTTTKAVANVLLNYIKTKGNIGYKVVELYEDLDGENGEAIKNFYAGHGNVVDLERTICGNRIKNLLHTIETEKEDGEKLLILSDRAIEEDITFVNSLMSRCTSQEESSGLFRITKAIETFLGCLNDVGSRIYHRIIYLDPDVDIALRNIRRRGRPSEQEIDAAKIKCLTTNDANFKFGRPVVVNNSKMTIDQTAMVVCLWVACNIIASSVPKVVTSVYGVPGAGKSLMVSALHNLLSCVRDWGKVCTGFVLDASEGEEIKSEQKKVYEDSLQKKSAEEMQEWIDNRRLSDWKNMMNSFYNNYMFFGLLAFTDIGGETSEIFRAINDCREDNQYYQWFRRNFTTRLNVVIDQEMSETRERIKYRNRPGEYNYFTERKLSDIKSEIDRLVKASCCPYTLTIVNDYTDDAITKGTVNIIWKLIYAIIRDYK